MNTNDSFDRRLGGWLVSEAQGRVADHLAETLVTTRATRQRRGWASLERWLPMATLVRDGFSRPRPLVGLGLVALVILGLLGAWVLSGASPAPLSLVPASNGRILYVDGTVLVSAASDGTDPRTLTTVAEEIGALAISPDGLSVAYIDVTGNAVRILSLASAADRGPSPISITAPGVELYQDVSWSPTGDRVVIVGVTAQRNRIFVASTDGSSVEELEANVIEDWVSSARWSPDGRWISFIGGPEGTLDGRIYLIHPDGSGLQPVESVGLVTGSDAGGLTWSPDAAAQRLLYVTSTGHVATFDLVSSAQSILMDGFWPAWSPTGDRVAFWRNGTRVMSMSAQPPGAASIEVFPGFSGVCQDHLDLTGKAFCGPTVWSPDGSRLIALDISRRALLSLRADGTGSPVRIGLASGSEPSGLIAWQPVRP
jgi:WD40 repeat protein